MEKVSQNEVDGDDDADDFVASTAFKWKFYIE
jgi:hypothetical protein